MKSTQIKINYLHYLFLFFLTFNFSDRMMAQLPSFHWAQSIGGLNTDDRVGDIELDELGNSYVVSNLANPNGNIDFDPGSGISNLPASDKMIVIQKIDTYGNLVWSYNLTQSNSNNFLVGTCISIQSSGKLLVGGYFSGTVDFDNSPTNSVLSCDGGVASFVLVIEPNGTFNSVFEFDSSTGVVDSTMEIEDIKVSGSNVNFVFLFKGSVNLYLNNATVSVSGDNNSYDVLILQTTLSFDYNWHGIIQCDNDNNFQNQEIACDPNGNLCMSGSFEGTLDVDLGADISNINSVTTNVYGACMLKYDSAGVLLFSRVIGGTLGINALDIEVDLQGNCFLAGRYRGTVDFDPNIGVTSKSSNAGTFDAYLLKLDNAGNFLWVNTYGGNTISDGAYGLDVDISGNVFLIGRFVGTVDFDNSSTATYNLTSTSSSVDSFILKITTSGAFVWAKNIGGALSELGDHIAVDNTGNVFCSGSYNSINCDFDPGASSFLLSATGFLDAFYFKLRNCIVPATPAVSPSGPILICEGSSIQLSSSASVLWNTGLNSTSISVSAPGSYYGTINNGIGCVSNSNTVIVSLASLSTATITPATTTTFCQGGSVVLNANTGTGLTYQWRLNGTNITGATTSTYTANASGSYTVVVTNTSTCSATSTANVVTVNALPTATITAASATTFCQGGSVVLNANTGSGLSYQWFNNAVAISAATSSSYTANASGSYTVVVTNTSTCSATSTAAVVTVNALPIATITASTATTFCQGGSVLLNANSGTGLTYQWRLNGTNITGATSSSYTANASGSYTVVVTNTSACSATSGAIVVTVNALPIASISPNGLVEICQGQSIALTANGGVTYLWSTGAPTQSITVNTEALYTVTVTDVNGCIDTESQFVKVNQLPNIGVNNASICLGQSATLTATGGLSYVWSPATGLSATTGSTVSSSTTTNAVYTVTGTGANGCTNSATATVTVNALPTATITAATTTTFCQGGSVVLNANTGTGLSYQWYNNAAIISGATFSSYTANASGSYTVVVTNTSTCSATSTATVVTVVPNVDYFSDVDGDGFGDAGTLLSTCVHPQGYVTDNTDCDDTSADVNPAATEVCNHIDDDCSGTIDDGLVFDTYYADVDGDTFGDANNSIYECSQPSGYVTNNTDCNDNNANQNTGSTEICNGEDDDCDGAIDNGITFLDYYADADGDGFGSGDVINSCFDLGAGYVTNNTDCDDANGNTFPGATETCNTIDDNCDGQIDEGVQTVYFIDNDGDTYGNHSVSILACTQPVGYTPNDTDCNDTNANINPGAEDIGGNGIDENCDGQIDNSILELNSTIALFPNPTSSELNIQINSSIIGNDLFIYDAVGKLVFKQQLLSTQTTIPVSNFADGNYVVRVGEVVKGFVVEK